MIKTIPLCMEKSKETHLYNVAGVRNFPCHIGELTISCSHYGMEIQAWEEGISNQRQKLQWVGVKFVISLLSWRLLRSARHINRLLLDLGPCEVCHHSEGVHTNRRNLRWTMCCYCWHWPEASLCNQFVACRTQKTTISITHFFHHCKGQAAFPAALPLTILQINAILIHDDNDDEAVFTCKFRE